MTFEKINSDPAAENYVEGSLVFENKVINNVGVRYKGSIGAWVGCLSNDDWTNPSGYKTCPKLSMKIKINLMKEMVGGDSDTPEKVAPLQGGEMLMVNVSTATSVGIVSNVGKGEATLSLRLPVVTEDGARVSLSRRVGTRWRLIGYGVVA